MIELLEKYRESGQAEIFGAGKIREAQENLPINHARSNDLHILALARTSNATLLFSNDKKLHDDFRNRKLLPNVGHRRRAVFPDTSSPKNQERFLSRRRCKNR